jgi:hypothetical protein
LRRKLRLAVRVRRAAVQFEVSGVAVAVRGFRGASRLSRVENRIIGLRGKRIRHDEGSGERTSVKLAGTYPLLHAR